MIKALGVIILMFSQINVLYAESDKAILGRFLTSEIMVRKGIDDLGGLTVKQFVKLLRKSVMNNGKSPKVKEVIKRKYGYSLRVRGVLTYDLNFVWAGGKTSLLRPIVIKGQGKLPALLYVKAIISGVPKK